MNCPDCQSPNEEGQKYCRTCGARLRTKCPGCENIILPSDRFCGECGLELRIRKKPTKKQEDIVSERKLITSLFADISGYTALSERLDPEEVKDLVSQIIGEIAQIVIKYEGHIENLAGDQVMALFGVPRAHEDDPVRAVKAASEIHQGVRRISPKVQETIGQPLAMHIGINTGIAITGHFDIEKAAAHLVAGDAVNVASRLCALAKPGETLVGQATYAQAAGFFDFEPLPPLEVKGKIMPVKAYRLLSPRELPSKRHRISGRRAPLIGRQREMAVLAQALARVQDGEAYSAVAICGEAGTGKSRLIEEFKATLDLKKITWMEGHAYAYTRNISYFPLIDLIKRDLDIGEEDTPGRMAAKLEARLDDISELKKEDLAPYFGGLLSLHYPGVAEMSPESWRSRLHQAVSITLKAQAKQSPVFICFEDMHWADPMFLNFLRGAVFEQVPRIILLYSYRPPLELFSRDEIRMMGESYQEIQLQDLSATEVQEMLASILETADIPQDLQRFVQEKVGTNPFYLEEMINSLIESGMLQPDNGSWRLTGAIKESEIPSSIHAVIAGRIDRLEGTVKYLLQEASVIGKTFPYEILSRITRHADDLNRHLEQLEDLALLRRSSQLEQEYEFKHALIQEVVYSGLLKKDRMAMHQRIGLVMEQVFSDRLPEFYETMAFHFMHSELSQKDLSRKAVDYLIKSGEKSVKRYALEEANQYYQEAFDLLSPKPERTKEENELLIDLLMKWCLLFYYQGRFEQSTEFLLSHVHLTESLEDKAKIGAYYCWLGHAAFWQGARLGDSYRYLLKALALGDETGNQQVISSACSFLIKTCAELGYLDEAEVFEARTREMLPLFPSDIFFQITYYSAKGYLGWFRGDKQKLYDSAQGLIDYGQKIFSRRCLMVGNMLMSFRRFIDLDLDAAIEYTRKVITQGDPYHAMFARLLQGVFLVYRREFEQAAALLTEVIENGERERTDYLKTIAHMFLGVSLAGQGRLAEGISLVESASQKFRDYQRTMFYSWAEFILGSIYLQILQKSGKRSLFWYIRNIGFLIPTALSAVQKAEKHLTEAMQLARDTGATGFLGQPCMQLGLFYKLRGKKEKSRRYLLEAVRIFKECKSEVHLKNAEELLGSLE